MAYLRRWFATLRKNTQTTDIQLITPPQLLKYGYWGNFFVGFNSLAYLCASKPINYHYMRFKHLLLIAVMGMGFLGVHADDYLHIQTADGWKVLNLNEVDRLSFKEGVMTAADSKGQTVATFNQQDLNTMFVADTAGLQTVESEASEATLAYDAQADMVRILADGDLHIYSATGAELLSIAGCKKGQTVDIAAISQKILILKSGAHALKIARK